MSRQRREESPAAGPMRLHEPPSAVPSAVSSVVSSPSPELEAMTFIKLRKCYGLDDCTVQLFVSGRRSGPGEILEPEPIRHQPCLVHNPENHLHMSPHSSAADTREANFSGSTCFFLSFEYLLKYHSRAKEAAVPARSSFR
ncbi:hypothetical protein EYF80_032661 [Liparis tanakae]|uniref:Uncharacterized protein n=1 Tax=Liparis tanakae TaxID=230148 RepID=A0A4Z2GU69_9TELE|nr:hypothetical protein EYF80_032661 [Liparis tanakae]